MNLFLDYQKKIFKSLKYLEKEIRRNHNIQIIKKCLIVSNESFWKERNVLVTGGASFIGSHIVDLLLKENIDVTVLDNFSTGRPENLDHVREQI